MPSTPLATYRKLPERQCTTHFTEIVSLRAYWPVLDKLAPP